MSTDYYVFPFHSKNFLGSHKVKGMSLAARGAYITLLAEQSTSENCELPNNDRMLARLCVCDGLDEWLSVKPEIMPCFIVSGDVIYNERMKEERARIDQLIVKKSEAGKKSGEARREQKTNTCSTPVRTPVRQVNEQNTEHNANTTGTERELTMNHEPRANNQEPKAKKQEDSFSEKPEADFSEAANLPNSNIEVTNESNLGIEEETIEVVKTASSKSKFESDTPSNIVSRFILEFCTSRSTPEQRAALNITECKAVRTEASTLMAEPGFEVNKLEAFRTWYKQKFGWKDEGYIPYKTIRANWHKYASQTIQNQTGGVAIQNGSKPAQNGTEKRISPDGKFVQYVNTATGNIIRSIPVGGAN